MNDIVVLGMNTGSYLVGEVKFESDYVIEFEELAVMHFHIEQDSSIRVWLAPYAPFGERPIQVYTHAIASRQRAEESVRNEYNRIFGSGILVPSMGILNG